MRFVYGKADWKDSGRGQENCFLLTNGLGGYCSQSITGSNARNDQALLMASLKAPVDRFHMVTRIEEELEGKGLPECGKVSLSGQQYVDYTKNRDGQKYLQSLVVDDLPVWIYQAGGLQIRKTVVMKYGENTVGIQYRMTNRGREDAKLLLTPFFQFAGKGTVMPEGKNFVLEAEEEEGFCRGTVISGGLALHFAAEGRVEAFETACVQDLYYAHDSRDGRAAVGRAAYNHRIVTEIPAGKESVCEVVYSMEDPLADGPGSGRVASMIREEKARLAAVVKRAGLQSETAVQLVKAADQFVVERESTGGKSIIAGYPFFGDWGRDTMIALTGCCISTGRFEDAKNIFRTFMKYCRRGIMPNMFPEGENPPMYNTADASLLFIGAVYEYDLRADDPDFVREAWDTMKEIIRWYREGTDFHIGMEEDGLIAAGAGLEQVTWMDVRYQDILPTPRHGKPVEINAYWYNALCVMAALAEKCGENGDEYRELAARAGSSFCEKFWNGEAGCLRDVLAADEPELPQEERERRKRAQDQNRCNQIWAVSQRFSMLTPEREKAVVDRVFETLYTPWGLRSLAPEDPEFKPFYSGSMKSRDLAYHQGTVWGFPLGGYYLAYLKVHGYSREAKRTVGEQLAGLEGALREGCAGQLAEVYDGENPGTSEGCVAQAWSTAELLRVYEALER